MADRDDIRKGEAPGPDDASSTLDDETPGADEAARASEKLRNENDPDNASSETS